MMKYEFEKLAGYEVSYEDYISIIEPMYMATELSKEEFVKTINKKRFALKTKKQYIADMKKIARHLYDTCQSYYDAEARAQLKAIADEYLTRFYDDFVDAMFNSEEKTYTSCYYPKTLEIYGKTTYKTIELITLV